MARKVLPVIYEVDVVDKGTKVLLREDRKVRRELGETTRVLGHMDREQAKLAVSANRAGGAQGRVARETSQTATALRRGGDAHRDMARGARVSADAEDKVLARLRRVQRETREAAGDQARLNRQRRQGASIRTSASAGIGRARVGIGGGAGAIAGVVGIASAGEAVRKMAEEYTEAAKVGGQTDAVIRSTGGAANVTATEVERLAQSLSNKVAVDDETIQSGANVLLTFSNIRNEAGRGKDIFDQTATAAVDMAAAMKTEPTAAAKMLGKALNDPEKGLTRLSRAGVTFTDQQEKQIKAMVKAGDTAGAQGIILDEVTRKFGGSARAQAQPVDRLKVAVDNLAESSGRALAPAVEKAATGLADFITEAQAGTGAGGRFAAQARKVGRELRPVANGLLDVGKFLARHPQLVVAAGGAWVSFRAARGVVGIFRSIRGASSATLTALGWMRKTQLGSALVDRIAGPLGGLRGRMVKNAQATRAPFTASMGRTGTVAGQTAARRTADGVADQLGPSLDGRQGRLRGAFRSTFRVLGRAGGIAAAAAIAIELQREVPKLLDKLTGNTGSRSKQATQGLGGPPLIDQFWGKLGIGGGRSGGYARTAGFRRFQGGGLVDAMLSPGEVVEYGGGAWQVPGARAAADTVHARLPVGAAVLTDHGQQLRAQGATVGQAIREQIPHFAGGGVVDAVRAGRRASWSGTKLVTGVAIAGPESGYRRNARLVSAVEDSRGFWQINTKAHPWSRGMDLSDPAVNARAAERVYQGAGGSWRPWTGFTSGRFRGYLAAARAAVTGNRGDTGAGPASGTDAAGSRSRTVSLGPLGRSRTRAGLLDDAFSQGIELGRQGVTRAALRLAGNPIGAASRAALEPGMFQRTSDVEGDRGGGSPSRGRNASRTVSTGGFRPGTRIAAMAAKAAQIDAARYQYSWGGGHGSIGVPSMGTRTSRGGKRGIGYDCSGAVSAVLSAGQLLKSPLTSGSLMGWGRPGSGKRLGVYADQGHVIMRIGNRFFGTGEQNPGGGAGWLTSNTMSGRGTVRTWPGMRRGGIIPSFATGGTVGGDYRVALPGGLSSMMGIGRPLRTAVNAARGSGAGTLEKLDEALGAAVDYRIGVLRRSIAREVRKGGDRRKILRLQQMLDTIDGELGRRVGFSERLVEQMTKGRERWAAQQDRAGRAAGIDPGSIDGIDRQRAVEAWSGVGMRQQRTTLERALKNAQRAGSREKATEIREQIDALDDDIAESSTRLIELARERVSVAAQVALDNAARRVDATQANLGTLEVNQRLANRQDTPQGMLERADYLRTRTSSALLAQRDAVGAEGARLFASGDAAGANQRWIEAINLFNEAAGAQADAAQLQRDAALQVAANLVDVAASGTTLADQNVERLELSQRLAGTYESFGAAEQRAQAIRDTIDERDRELIALQGQKAEAERQGNADLVRQLAEAIGSKELDIMRRQLEAQEATQAAAEATADRLKEFGGSTAFEARGGTFTDLISVGLGA